MIESGFKSILEAWRAYFNARFAEKQITRPELDGNAFLDVLRRDVAPVVEAITQSRPDAALVAGQHLYDLALDLFAQGLLGPDPYGTNAVSFPNAASFPNSAASASA